MDSAAARRMVLNVFQHVEIAKTFRARAALMMQSLRKTQTLTPESLDCITEL